MEFLLALRLQALPFDAAVAGTADAAVELVVVMLAIWSIVDHVKGRSSEGLAARLAHEALFVVASCQAPVCRLY
jgi:hypothetical protein